MASSVLVILSADRRSAQIRCKSKQITVDDLDPAMDCDQYDLAIYNAMWTHRDHLGIDGCYKQFDDFCSSFWWGPNAITFFEVSHGGN